MATQPTTRPVPSESPRDLKFNVGKIDEFVTSMGWTYTDRFGNTHYTIEGLRWLAQQSMSAFGYITLDSFQDGANLTLPNQVLRDKTTGEYYRWDGAFPKNVPTGSTPEGSGGIGIGAWVSVGDASLRTDLLSNDESRADALIRVQLPTDGSVERTQHAKNQDIISVFDFGIKADGVSDDSVAFQVACDYASEHNKKLHVNGNIFISSSITVRCDLVLDGGVTISGPSGDGSSPIVGINLPFGGKLKYATMNNLNINFFSDENITNKNNFGAELCFIRGRNLAIYIGAKNKSVRHVVLDNIYSSLSRERSVGLINLINVSDFRITNITCMDYSWFVNVQLTRSLCNTNGYIGNIKSTSAAGININGTIMNRFSKIIIENCDIDRTSRSDSTSGGPCVNIVYASRVIMKNVRATAHGRPVYMESCTSVNMENITAISDSDIANWRVVHFNGCSRVSLKKSNIIFSTIGYGTPAISVTGSNISKSDQISIEGCLIKSARSAINVANATNIKVFNNKTVALAPANFNSDPVIYIASSVDFGNVYANETVAPSGVERIQNLSSTVFTSTANQINDRDMVKTITPLSVGVIDPDLNNAKSYVFSFKTTDVSMIKSIVGDTTTGVVAPKTLSEYMSTVSGATLAWNASGWQMGTNKIPDIISNGVVRDGIDSEFYPFTAAVIFDIDNKLSCRDFTLSGDDGTSTTHSENKSISSAALSEDAYHAAFFIPPLVVNGDVYDISLTGVSTNTDYYVTLSARMAVGQKSDGTYILLAVDGQTNVSGCTIDQLAKKMKALGCVNACNLDGGGSATLWYNGAIINSPAGGVERKIPHVMYI